MNLKKTLCLMLVALGVIVYQPTAQAVYMQFQYFDGVSFESGSIDDNGVGDSNSTAGIMSVSITTANWIISASTALTYNTLGSITSPQLDFVNVSATSVGGAVPQELLIGVSANGYIGQNGFNFLVGGTTVGTVTFDSFFDSTNALFGASGGSIGLLVGNTGAFGEQTQGADNPYDFGTPYSLTITADILHGDYACDENGQNCTFVPQIGATSFNANLSAVPEPGSLLLLGFGLISLLGIGRRTNS